ncbi:MAG: FGGY family carbohydrate kinase [Calditrichia bacterium]
MKTLFLGIDSSTQGCKVVCINTGAGKIEYVDSINYDHDLPEYQTNGGVILSSQKNISEADPNMWLDALDLLFSRMVENKFPIGSIRAISVSGQQHGLVALDIAGNLTRSRSKLWNDYSTAEECDLLTAAVGGPEKMISEIGNTQRPGYTAGKILHFYRHEAEAAKNTATFFLVHNFINWFLTGGKKGGIRMMEPGDVSGMALRHPGSNDWNQTVCNAISPDLMDKLSPVQTSDKMIGFISKDLVQKYGFDEDCRIDAGSGDNMYGAIGTGNIRPGIVTISLGTSGTAYTITDEPYVDPQGEIASFCDSTGKFMPLLCVSNMANGYNQILDLFNLNHKEFDDILHQTPPGNQGKLLFPWYMGERTPDLPEASPIYWGFGLNDFQKPVLCRAVLEGHVLNLYDGFHRMPVVPREIRLTGGLSKSEAWCQTIADVFGIETVPVEGEGAALGAAIHAAWAYSRENGSESDLQSLTQTFVKVDETRRKIPENKEAYLSIKEAYSEISLRIRTGTGKTDPFKIFNGLIGS